MNILKTTSIVALLTLGVFSGHAQNEQVEPDSSKTMPFQMAFVYPMSTNGMESKDISNKTSINIISGFTGGVEGFEWAGVSNYTKGNVRGFQAAGFSNWVTGDVVGHQAAGFGNLNKGEFKGVQASGFSNISLGNMKGSQMSGFLNYTGQKFKGAQLAGFANVSVDTTTGTQLAGFMNVSNKKMNGLQMAGFSNVAVETDKTNQVAGFLNVAIDSSVNSQISGFMNLAHHVKKSQIGVVNICDSIDGTPIGFISLVRNGYRALEIEANETFYLNINGKIGVKKFYNIFTLGAKPMDNKIYWTMGYGFGGQLFEKNKFSANTDFIVGHFNEGVTFSPRLNLFNQLKLNFAYKLKNKTAIYGGPFVSYHIQELRDWDGKLEPTVKVSPLNIFDKTDNYYRHLVGLGFNLGVRF